MTARATKASGRGTDHGRRSQALEATDMAHDPDLADRVRNILGPRQGITEKKMFGGLAFLLHGHMLLAVSDRGLMARIGPEGFEAALARDHVRKMDFTGRPMK